MTSHKIATPDHPIAIIGGGLAGLSAAYDLGKSGLSVILLEGEPELGGLASSFKLDDAPLERFYHFICRSDTHLLELVTELEIGNALHWRQVSTGYFHDGKLYPFGTPLNLLRFNPVPFVQRIRFGLNILKARYLKNWRALDRQSAKQWLIAEIGAKAYSVIWEPLLRVKFGADEDKISAAWIWHRIWRVATSRQYIWEPEKLGYLEHGSSTMINALVKKIQTYPNVKVITKARVAHLEIANGFVQGIRLQNGDYVRCGIALSTIPLPLLTQIAPALPRAYSEQLTQTRYIGIVCFLFRLRQALTKDFWVNINDPRIAFNGFIEYTNLNPRPDLNGSHIIYVPFYTPVSSERFARDDKSLFDEYVTALQIINPSFSRDWIEEYFVFRERFAQAICPVGYSQIVPAHATPVPNLYLTDSAQFYPEDRTISAAIRVGRHVAKMIAHQNKGGDSND